MTTIPTDSTAADLDVECSCLSGYCFNAAGDPHGCAFCVEVEGACPADVDERTRTLSAVALSAIYSGNVDGAVDVATGLQPVYTTPLVDL
ncbi:MAG: hypothetical protein ACRDWT_08115, partial [Jatrophihabitantaceae bacterium]